MKTRKSVTKRFKMTKNGIILRRASGFDHSLAKKSGNRIRAGRKWVRLAKNEIKKIKKMMPR